MSVSVNYVWMEQNREAPSPIPTYFFRRLQDNAERYPKANFQLWVESDQSHEPYDKPANVEIHQLNEVPSFSTSPTLQAKKDIWPRVDMARLLVLQHVLDTTRFVTAAYADFDIPDVQLCSTALQARLERFGLALGGTVDPSTGVLITPFHNGYMAFQSHGKKILDYVIARLECRRRSTGRNRSVVYFAMVGALERCAKGEAAPDTTLPMDWRETVASLPVAPPPLWRDDTHLIARLNR